MNSPAHAPIAGLSADAFSSLFQAVGGLRNHRALLAMAACLAVGVLVGGAAAVSIATLGAFGALLAGLVFFVAAATGVNAAGVLHMDHARGQPPRSLVDALVYGLLCIPKLLVLGLGFFAISLALFLVLAIVFFVCKIPYLGALLYVVVFPLSVVLAGVTLAGLSLCSVFALPAIWQGATIGAALAQALAIVRSRLVEAFLMLAVIWLLSFFVGLIVFGVLGLGLMPTVGLSASILGFGGFTGGMGMGAGSSGHAIAGAIGGGLLWALAATLVSQVWLLGVNLVFLRVSEGLDTAGAQRALVHGFDEAKRRAAEVAQKARDAAERAREHARQPAAAPPPAAPVAAAPVAAAPPAATGPAATPIVTTGGKLSCPMCHAAVTPDDLFCGICGQKLK